MTKHQFLQLQRHLRTAARRYREDAEHYPQDSDLYRKISEALFDCERLRVQVENLAKEAK
jgi:hypothetical protein